MTLATSTWAIPYATDTDRLCDGAAITQSMAERVDDVLAAFDTDLAFLQNVPSAGLQVSVTFTQVETGGCTSPYGIRFDTVNYDTDNMANLPVDPSIITYRRVGYYQIGGVVTFFEPPSTAGQRYTATLFSTRPTGSPLDQMERDQLETMLKTTGGLNFNDTIGAGSEGEIDIELCRFGTTNGSPVTIAPPSMMWARWIREA